MSSAGVSPRTFGDDPIVAAGDDLLDRNAFAARAVDVIRAVLVDCGYEPCADREGMTLINCPFHVLAQEYTALVFAMNLDLMDGFADFLHDAPFDPWLTRARPPLLSPTDDRCHRQWVERDGLGAAVPRRSGTGKGRPPRTNRPHPGCGRERIGRLEKAVTSRASSGTACTSPPEASPRSRRGFTSVATVGTVASFGGRV